MNVNVAQKVSELIQPLFAKDDLIDLELVDVEYKKEGTNWFLRIFIEKDAGITLDDCQLVSKKIEPILDEQDPVPTSFFLEVSSPGIERPLKKIEDFDKFKGYKIRIKTFAPIDGNKEYVGELVSLFDNDLTVIVNDNQVKLPFDKVASVNLTVD